MKKLLCLTMCLVVSASVFAGVYSQTFDTDAAAADFGVTAYTEWTQGAGAQEVLGGEMVTASGGINYANVTASSLSGGVFSDFGTSITVEADLTSYSTNSPIGIMVGDGVAKFHAGYTEGWFRYDTITDTGAGDTNSDMGFVGGTLNGTLYHFAVTVTQNGSGDYDWDTTITEGTNSFNKTFTMAAATLGTFDRVGFWGSPSGGTSVETMDNFVLTGANVVPEPATMALLGLGALVLRRRK